MGHLSDIDTSSACRMTGVPILILQLRQGFRYQLVEVKDSLTVLQEETGKGSCQVTTLRSSTFAVRCGPTRLSHFRLAHRVGQHAANRSEPGVDRDTAVRWMNDVTPSDFRHRDHDAVAEEDSVSGLAAWTEHGLDEIPAAADTRFKRRAGRCCQKARSCRNSIQSLFTMKSGRPCRWSPGSFHQIDDFPRRHAQPIIHGRGE